MRSRGSSIDACRTCKECSSVWGVHCLPMAACSPLLMTQVASGVSALEGNPSAPFDSG